MLKVNHLSFGYTKNKVVLEQINFTLKAGEHLSIMGASGCGKSTLLKAIYGLLDLNEGNIFWNDEEVLGPEFNLVPGFHKFKYVAQDFDLMPYISVAENIKKHLSRFYPKESELRTHELLEVIEMTAFKDVKVKNLSGGQKQRVAIARALAKEPQLLLLDEPFSQIDNYQKNTLRRSLFGYLKEKKIASIVATHDKNDALSFADELLIIKDNKVLVHQDPKEIYKNPKKKYIAALFDDVNEIKVNEETLLLYPHQIKIVSQSNLKAEVKNAYFKGSFWLIEVLYKKQKIFVKHACFLAANSQVFLEIEKVTKNKNLR